MKRTGVIAQPTKEEKHKFGEHIVITKFPRGGLDPRNHIGVTVVRKDLLLPQFLYYAAEYAWRLQIYQRICVGVITLQHIRQRDVRCALTTVLGKTSRPNPDPDPDARRRKFLRDKEATAIQNRPEYARLREKLLRIAGEFVLFVDYEPDFEKIMTSGVGFESSTAEMVEDLPSKCHTNAAVLWIRDPERYRIVTGYAMSTEGISLWRQHSWGYDALRDVVLETTAPREHYFGYILTRSESVRFCKANYDPDADYDARWR